MSRIFAISDIHGCFSTFYELVVNVLDLRKSDRLILLGDYIDRGEGIRDVIDFIIDLKDKGFNLTALRGNHEDMLMDSGNDPEIFALWMMNKGLTTLNSFEITGISQMNKKYTDFFSSLEYYHETGNCIFVHAGFNDLLADPFSDYETMLWECSPSYFNPLLKGKTIVHGHRPKFVSHVRKLISEKSDVIPIDTGCVYEKELGYGFLSALNVGEMELI
ncbi:MAG: metallophosphoesterase family protein [Bacteroidales bacterium]|jgi:serine/threonine protein phosphatase 1